MTYQAGDKFTYFVDGKVVELKYLGDTLAVLKDERVGEFSIPRWEFDKNYTKVPEKKYLFWIPISEKYYIANSKDGPDYVRYVGEVVDYKEDHRR
jgi:hypothetical protein